MKPYQIHPAAELMPRMTDEEYEEFLEDCRANGIQEPIKLLGNQLIDGRHRQQAAIDLGLVPEIVEIRTADPVRYVLSLNLHRRHLSSSQRAMLAANLANMEQGARTDLAEPSAEMRKVSQTEAAEMLKVSPRSVTAAKKVKDSGRQDLVDAVTRGEMPVTKAEAIVTGKTDKPKKVPNPPPAAQPVVGVTQIAIPSHEAEEPFDLDALDPATREMYYENLEGWYLAQMSNLAADLAQAHKVMVELAQILELPEGVESEAVIDAVRALKAASSATPAAETPQLFKRQVQMSGWIWRSPTALFSYFNNGSPVRGEKLAAARVLAEDEGKGWAFALQETLVDLYTYGALDRRNRLSPEREADLPKSCLPANQDRLSPLNDYDRQYTPDWAILPEGVLHDFDSARQIPELVKTAQAISSTN